MVSDHRSAWVIVRQKQTPFISIPIDDDMNPRFDMVSRAF
jgi:hypothetical protein